MKNNIWWTVTVKNSVALIAWVVLAVVFNKWWIALFATLFMSDYTMATKYKTYRICDGCGKRSPYADSYNEALDKAKEAGWTHLVDGNKDYCPDCHREFKEKYNNVDR